MNPQCTNTPLKPFQNQFLYGRKFEKCITILTQRTMLKNCFVCKTGKAKNSKMSFILFLPKKQKLHFRNAKFLIINKHYFEYTLNASYGVTEFQQQRTMSYCCWGFLFILQKSLSGAQIRN